MTVPLQPPGKKTALAFAALLGLGLLFSYCYHRAQARQAETDLLNLQHQAQRLARLQSALPALTSPSLPQKTVIEQSAQRHRLALKAVTPEEGGFSVTVSPMAFERLIAWLAELQRDQDIRVQTLEVTALPVPGSIRIDALHLQRRLSN